MKDITKIDATFNRELDADYNVEEYDIERDFEHIELDANGERRTRIDNDAED